MSDQDDPQEPRGPAPRRRRIRRPRPDQAGSVLPWALAAWAGDPVLIVVTVAQVALLALLTLLAGAPGDAEVIVPLVSPPPIDAYHDTGVADAVATGGGTQATLRVAALALRTWLFGLLAALAVRRVRGEQPSIPAAAADVRFRLRRLATLELFSFAVFGSVLILRGPLAVAGADPEVRYALLAGLLFLPTAFIAVLEDGLGPAAAARRSAAWIRRRPLGHLAITAFAYFGVLGAQEIAGAGVTGRPPPLATTLLALLAAAVTSVFVLAIARRYALLYSTAALQAPRPRPGRRR